MAKKTQSKKIVAVVGHCGMDGPFMTETLQDNLPPTVEVVRVNDLATAERLASDPNATLLINNNLIGSVGYDDPRGVDLIRSLKAKQAKAKLVMISDYDEVQTEALAVGGIRGMGKSLLYQNGAEFTDKVKKLMSQRKPRQPRKTAEALTV